MTAGPPLVLVVGWKDSGKTTVAVKLVAALRRRGRRVVALKHGHGFELDREGTDSWRLRHEAGAERVVLAGPDAMAVMGSWPPGGEPGPDDIAVRFASDADVVVAEGWKREAAPKVVVRRGAGDRGPLYEPGDPLAATVVAVVTDLPPGPGEPDVPRLDPDDPGTPDRLAAAVERALGLGSGP